MKKKCDDFAIRHTDEATYKSAIRKTKVFLTALRKEHGVERSEVNKKMYGHRDLITESHRNFGNMHSKSDTLIPITKLIDCENSTEEKAFKLYERMKAFAYHEYDDFKSPRKFEITKSGNCWSFAEAEEEYAGRGGLKSFKFYIFTEANGNIMTHSFIVIQNHNPDKRYIYIEAAFKRIKGIYTCTDMNTVFDHVLKAISEQTKNNTFKYVIFEYTGQHPPYGCSDEEFMNWIPEHCEDIDDGIYSNKTIIKEEYEIMDMEYDRMRSLRLILEGDDEADENDNVEAEEEDTPKKKAPSRFKKDEDEPVEEENGDEDNSTDDSDDGENGDDDSDLDDFGNNGGDDLPNNEYDPKEVETLNNLMASEADAMNEYLDAARVSRVDVLQRLYADIANEERFHMEQLLFAKSEITGEKYVPRDKDVRKEYEELLELGMDEDTAMATAVDKVGISVKTETTDADVENLNEDMKKLEGDVELMEQMANQIILVSYICEYAERSHDAELINEVNMYQESMVIMEDVTGIPQVDKKYTKSVNPIKVAWNLFVNFLKFLRNLAKNMQKFRAQLNYRIAKTREWCKKHGGIGALFAGEGIWMYIWDDKANNVNFDGLSYYANLLWAMTQNIAQQTQSQNPEIQKILSINDQPFDLTNQKGYAIDKKTDAKKIIQILNQAILTKTKILFNENNRERLNEIFLGVKTDDTIKYDSRQKLNPASFNNVYVALGYMQDRIMIYSQYAEKLTEALGKMEGEPNGLFHTNNNLYIELCKYMQTSAKWYTKLGKIIHNDIDAIMKITSAGNKPDVEDQNPDKKNDQRSNEESTVSTSQTTQPPAQSTNKQIPMDHPKIQKHIKEARERMGYDSNHPIYVDIENGELKLYHHKNPGDKWIVDTVKFKNGLPDDLKQFDRQTSNPNGTGGAAGGSGGTQQPAPQQSQQPVTQPQQSQQPAPQQSQQQQPTVPQQPNQPPTSKGNTLIGGQTNPQQPQNQDLQIALNEQVVNNLQGVQGCQPKQDILGNVKFEFGGNLRISKFVIYDGKGYPNPNKYKLNGTTTEGTITKELGTMFDFDGLSGNDTQKPTLVGIVPAQFITDNNGKPALNQKGKLTFTMKA